MAELWIDLAPRWYRTGTRTGSRTGWHGRRVARTAAGIQDDDPAANRGAFGVGLADGAGRTLRRHRRRSHVNLEPGGLQLRLRRVDRLAFHVGDAHPLAEGDVTARCRERDHVGLARHAVVQRLGDRRVDL